MIIFHNIISAHSTHHTTNLPNYSTTIVLPDGQPGNSKDTHLVKPMVSGYTIHKPKVRLQRVNLSLPLMSQLTQESRDTVSLHTSNVLRRRTYPTNALDPGQTPETGDIEDEMEDSPETEETTLTSPTIVSPLIEEDDDFEDLTPRRRKIQDFANTGSGLPLTGRSSLKYLLGILVVGLTKWFHTFHLRK
ncbi:unnamed protein product, partial [Timema podura]|nr:unnamed protein product [Timema podura]